MITSSKLNEQYLKSEIETASPLKRVVMLYDGAIYFIEDAKEKMSAKKYTDATISNIRAQNIISELKSSLNMDYGDLPERLNALYSYFLKKLISANMERKIEFLEEVLKHLAELRNSWNELLEKEEGGGK